MPEATISSESVFYHVSDLISKIVPLFGLHSTHPQLAQTYRAILAESLAFPLGTKPVGHSRINHDGTPIQFTVALGNTSHRFFQFLGEAGTPGISGIDRLLVNRKCIAAIAETMQLEYLLLETAELINKMIPETDVDLVNDPSGAFWIGAGFSSSNTPQLKIYMNVSWRSMKDRWISLREFAAYFGAFDYWEKLITPYESAFKPLGIAITLKEGATPSGRIYLSAYGKRISFYDELAKSVCDGNFQAMLQEFSQIMLAEDYPYPTQTAVCSFGLQKGSEMDFKFELCGHCLFKSDAEAFSRIKSWSEISSLESSLYQDMLGILSGDQLSKTFTELHCFVGVGQKHGSIYSTVYLKPKLYGIDQSQ